MLGCVVFGRLRIMNSAAKFSLIIGQMFQGGVMSKRFAKDTNPGHTRKEELTLFAGEIHAKETAPQENQRKRVLAVSSSELLMHFAHALWCERILQLSEKMHPGLGGGSDWKWSALATLCCPSDYEPVALALSIDGKGCSCCANYPTPTATDWKGGHDLQESWKQFNLRDWWRRWTGLRYLPPEVSTAVQGFPITWTKCVP